MLDYTLRQSAKMMLATLSDDYFQMWCLLPCNEPFGFLVCSSKLSLNCEPVSTLLMCLSYWQLSKTMKQVRRRLASCKTVPKGAGLPELPGGVWGVSPTRNVSEGLTQLSH